MTATCEACTLCNRYDQGASKEAVAQLSARSAVKLPPSFLLLPAERLRSL